MTKLPLPNNPAGLVTVNTGVLSKAEAVLLVDKGCRYIFSTELGKVDPVVKMTHAALLQGAVPLFPWENGEKEEMTLGGSRERQAISEAVVARCKLERKRFLREKVQSVLEELMTNVLFHAYRNADGKEKYARRQEAVLASRELIAIRFSSTAQGIYLSVKDQAGSLKFEEMARALSRCYSGHSQIENKESGAGLGTYMIFDAVTHLKVVSAPGQSTEIACWIADQRSFDNQHFSFSFFERSTK
ncbi:hypothetical protein K2X33_06310 [bacterium]|nr:hypothetical protein [bacterium]